MSAREDRRAGAREEILDRLRPRDRDLPAPAPWTESRRFEDPADRFSVALTAALGEPRRARDPGEARAILGGILGEIGARRVVADDHPSLQGLADSRPGLLWQTPDSGGNGFRAACAAADAGVSVAEAGLAETGSVVLAAGPGRSRLASLLPPVHVVLLPRDRLLVDLFAWTAVRPDPLPSQLVLVSGPSKTADIEQTLAVGVHGPGRFVVIVVDGL